MKHFVSLLFVLMLCSRGMGQLRAVTGNGDEVILNANGTWEYVSKDAQNSGKTDTNSVRFTKDKEASFIVKSNRTEYAIYINPKKWSFEKSKEDEVSEFGFTLRNKDAYAMLITEKIEIPLENLKEIALENARSVAPDVKIVKSEYRWVNNNAVLLLQMEGTLQGIKFTYYGYYFSAPSGTVQFLTYTATSLFDASKAELEEFLNGFVAPR